MRRLTCLLLSLFLFAACGASKEFTSLKGYYGQEAKLAAAQAIQLGSVADAKGALATLRAVVVAVAAQPKGEELARLSGLVKSEKEKKELVRLSKDATVAIAHFGAALAAVDGKFLKDKDYEAYRNGVFLAAMAGRGILKAEAKTP